MDVLVKENIINVVGLSSQNRKTKRDAVAFIENIAASGGKKILLDRRSIRPNAEEILATMEDFSANIHD